jgi:hypothetical protein
MEKIMEIKELFSTKEEQNDLSVMAGGIALQRFAETILPEEVRIFSEPYGVQFIDQGKTFLATEHPQEIREIIEKIEKLIPGWNDAIRGHIRYFAGYRQLLMKVSHSNSIPYRTRVFPDQDHLTTGICSYVLSGKNAGGKVSGLMSLAYATVPAAGDRTS